MEASPGPGHSLSAVNRGESSALGSVSERRAALRRAWTGWAALVILPVIGTAMVLAVLPVGGEIAMNGAAWFFLITAVFWLVLVVPGIYGLRSHCFRAAWHGRVVEPVSYVRCMSSVWAVVEVGCVLSLAGIVASGTLLPCVIPGVMAFMILATARPHAQAIGL